MRNKKVLFITQGAVIAAIYVVLTVSPICWDAVMDFPDIMSFSKFSLLLIYISFFKITDTLGKSPHTVFHG